MLYPKRGIALPPLASETSPNQSSRQSVITAVVVHDTEGGFDGAVRWLRDPRSQVSAHLVLNEQGTHAVQLVPYHRKAWACAAFNSCSINLEMAGFEAAGYPDRQLRVAARIVAYLCHRFDLPARYIGDHMAREGFTFHQDLGRAGGGHHDPGLYGLRKQAFIGLVTYEARRGNFRSDWGE